MVKYKTAIHQFGIISGIRQDASDRLTIITPGSLFAPEARKGQLLIMAEPTDDLTRGRDACQMVTKTIQKTFYEDHSFSITSSLRKAIREANEALYQHNFRTAHHQRTAVGVSCAVLRDGDLYLAQLQPTQAYIAHAGRLRALPPQLTWNPASPKAGVLLPPNALGSSLFAEPDLRRNPIGPGDTLVFCSTNIARLLGRDEAERLFCYEDGRSALETLYTLSKRNSLPDAHAVIVELLPLLSPEARDAPLSPSGVGERGKIVAQSIGGWFAGLTGEAALLLRRSERPAPAPQAEEEPGEEEPDEDALIEEAAPAQATVEPPAPARGESARRLSHHEPLHATAYLGERLPASFEAKQPTTIDLGDQVPLPVDFAAIPKKQPLPPPRIVDRLTWPFRAMMGMLVTLLASLFRRSPRREEPDLPHFGGGGLSYRRQRRPLPWKTLVLLIGIVILAVIYGREQLKKDRVSAIEKDILAAEEAYNAAASTSDDAAALAQLEEVHQRLVRASQDNGITQTDALWPQYMRLQTSVGQLESSIKRLNLLQDLELVATLPQTETIARLIVPPNQGGDLLYVLTEESKVILEVKPRTKEITHYFGQGTPARELTADPPVDVVWRDEQEAIAPVSRAAQSHIVYLFNPEDPGNWLYNRLSGSEPWPERPDIEAYGGNLYVWGGARGQVLKYSSGLYSDLPSDWILDSKGEELETAIDMAVDGQIYLLMPNGEVLVLKENSFDRRMPAPKIAPGIRQVTRLYASGDSSESGHLYLLEPATERVLELSKTSGEVLQQMQAPPNGPQLNRLSDLVVIEQPNQTAYIYLANGNQILRAKLPAAPPPREIAPPRMPTGTGTPRTPTP